MADILPRPWRFTQLSRAGTGRVLDLSGPNAPFGRPRRSPVVTKARELREVEFHYPGNPVPTRHIYGDRQEPIKLSGRFMDSRIGVDGGAKTKDREVDSFVADQLPVYIEWGGILAFTGLLTRYESSYESEQEIAWSLTAKIDTNDTTTVQSPPPAATSTSQQWGESIGRLLAAQSRLNPPTLPADIEYEPSFLDSIATSISNINAFSASIASVVDSVDNFESTVSADVERFLGGLHQLQNSVDQLMITLSTGVNDEKVAQSSANSQVQWYDARGESLLDLEETLALFAAMHLSAERALQGTPDRTIRARGGDSWEAIAIAQLGSSSRADALRQANKVRYGAQPRAGQLIHIPKR